MDVDQRLEGLVAQLKELKLKDLTQRQTVNSDDTHSLLRVPVATVLTDAHAHHKLTLSPDGTCQV